MTRRGTLWASVAPLSAIGTCLLLASPGCSSGEAIGEPPPDTVDLAFPTDQRAQRAELDASADAAPPAGDSLPTGAVSFYNRTRCPQGWEPLLKAAGRTLVPTVEKNPGGVTQGEPLDDSEDRVHGHAVTASVSLPAVNYAGIAGEANHGVARAGSIPMMVTASKASSGLPYVQLLVCQKSAAADPLQQPAPSGMLMFFATAECPSGWSQAGLSQGRFLVGLPEGGTPGQKFGGKTLGPGEKRTHKHGLQGSLKTTAHGIALASGGAANGYAKDDTHTYQATSDEESVAMPYLQLLQCQKE